MLRGSQAPRRAVCGTRGSLRTMHGGGRGLCVVPSPTGLPSKRGPGLGSFSRADRGIGGSAGKESACNAGDTGDAGLIPGLGRSPEEGNGPRGVRPRLEGKPRTPLSSRWEFANPKTPAFTRWLFTRTWGALRDTGGSTGRGRPQTTSTRLYAGGEYSLPIDCHRLAGLLPGPVTTAPV